MPGSNHELVSKIRKISLLLNQQAEGLCNYMDTGLKVSDAVDTWTANTKRMIFGYLSINRLLTTEQVNNLPLYQVIILCENARDAVSMISTGKNFACRYNSRDLRDKLDEFMANLYDRILDPYFRSLTEEQLEDYYQKNLKECESLITTCDCQSNTQK